MPSELDPGRWSRAGRDEVAGDLEAGARRRPGSPPARSSLFRAPSARRRSSSSARSPTSRSTRRPRAVHRASGSTSGSAFLRGVQVPGRGGDHRAPRDPPDDERLRDLAPQPLPEEMVMTETQTGVQDSGRGGRTRRAAVESSIRRDVVDVTDRDRVVRRRARARGRVARGLPQSGHGFHRPVGLRQVDLHPLLQPHERPDPERDVVGTILYHGQDLYGDSVDPVEVRS